MPKTTQRRIVLEHRTLVIDRVAGIISQADIDILDLPTKKVYTVHIEDLDPTRHDFMGTVQVEFYVSGGDEPVDERDVPVGIALAAIAHCIRLIAEAEDEYDG